MKNFIPFIFLLSLTLIGGCAKKDKHNETTTQILPETISGIVEEVLEGSVVFGRPEHN